MDEQWQDSQPTPSAPEAPDNLGVPELTGVTDVTGLTEDTAAKAAANRTRKDTSLGYELYLNVRTLVFVLAALILIFTFVVRIIVVSGRSMENTLQNGDSMLVWCLGYEPKQGDVVVLTQRSYQNDSLVKRVIATEGQRVDIDYDTGTVYVDGAPLEEDYIKEAMQVPNYGEPGHGPRLVKGMTLAIEPMVNAGTYDIRVLDNDWTVVTADGKLSAHYENTILITDGEPEILTMAEDI